MAAVATFGSAVAGVQFVIRLFVGENDDPTALWAATVVIFVYVYGLTLVVGSIKIADQNEELERIAKEKAKLEQQFLAKRKSSKPRGRKR